MKFIQLLSTIASLAIFATAPGVSAAGVRASVDKTADQSAGRRKLYHRGHPHRGPRGPRGPGVPVDFNDSSESQYYNQMYNHGYGGGYYEGDYEDYANPGYNGYEYEYGGPSRSHGGGHGGDADAYCRKFKNERACHAHDHDSCGWDDSRGCHSY